VALESAMLKELVVADDGREEEDGICYQHGQWLVQSGGREGNDGDDRDVPGICSRKPAMASKPVSLVPIILVVLLVWVLGMSVLESTCERLEWQLKIKMQKQ